MRHTIQPEDVDAVHQQRIALRPIIAIERERTLYRESHVDDTATSLAEKIVDTEIENVYSPLNSRTFPKAITKNCDKRPAAAFFAKAAAGLLSEFFVITLRNVLLFRGAVNILDFCNYDFFRKRDCRIITPRCKHKKAPAAFDPRCRSLFYFFLFSQNTLNFPYPLGLSSSNSSVLT